MEISFHALCKFRVGKNFDRFQVYIQGGFKCTTYHLYMLLLKLIFVLSQIYFLLFGIKTKYNIGVIKFIISLFIKWYCININTTN